MTELQTITKNAERLYEIRKLISDKEDALKVELESLKAERDAVQVALIADLTKNGLASIKVASGETYSKAIRRGISITNEAFALKWALEAKAVKIDTVVAGQLLRGAEKLPKGIEATSTEYISVRKPKEEIIN